MNYGSSKSAEIVLSKSIFYLKNPGIFLIFFCSLKNTNLGAHFLVLLFFDNINYFITKMMPNFSSSPLHQFPLGWFLGKTISNFLSLPWKLNNHYCHIIQYRTQLFPNRPQFCKLVEIRRNTERAINNDPEGSPRVAPMASSFKHQGDFLL